MEDMARAPQAMDEPGVYQTARCDTMRLARERQLSSESFSPQMEGHAGLAHSLPPLSSLLPRLCASLCLLPGLAVLAGEKGHGRREIV